MVKPLPPHAIEEAWRRIVPHVHKTPMLESTQLNHWLGHKLWFKCEALQKTGAFKIRGALNAMLSLKERGALPNHVVAFSSGNHAQAVAYAARMLGVRATIFIPENSSRVKCQATADYGAKVELTASRQEAEEKVAEEQKHGAYVLHPFDNDDVILGQGTACFEALKEGIVPDAIFAPCGGGGLLSGTWLAAQLLQPNVPVYAGEPRVANDAARSYHEKKIVSLTETPDTIADGARTLKVSERTFIYLQRLAGFYEIDEAMIVYWVQWLSHLLKINVEPTSALAMAAAQQWLEKQQEPKTVLIILSGGNIDTESRKKIWQKDCLEKVPPRNDG